MTRAATRGNGERGRPGRYEPGHERENPINRPEMVDQRGFQRENGRAARTSDLSTDL